MHHFTLVPLIIFACIGLAVARFGVRRFNDGKAIESAARREDRYWLCRNMTASLKKVGTFCIGSGTVLAFFALIFGALELSR